MPRVKTLLNGIATGILVILLWDVLAHAWAPVDSALGHGETLSALGNGAVLSRSPSRPACSGRSTSTRQPPAGPAGGARSGGVPRRSANSAHRRDGCDDD